jgi:hypothetical protein
MLSEEDSDGRTKTEADAKRARRTPSLPLPI